MRDPSTRVTGHVASREHDFLLELRIERSQDVVATRELAARDCQELTNAAAWLVALALGPSLADEAKPAEPEAPATNPPPKRAIVEPLSETPRPPDPARDTQLPHRLRLGLLAGATAHGLAGVHPLLGAYVGFGVRRWYTAAQLSQLFARSPQLADAAVSFSGQTLSALQCLEWEVYVRLLPCLGGRVTRLRIRTDVDDEARTSTTYWLSAAAALQAFAVVFAPFELDAALTLTAPLTKRPRFVLGEAGEVGKVSLVGWEFALGFGVRL